MKAFLIGTGMFLGWWVLCAIGFMIFDFILVAMIGPFPDFLEFGLWMLYIAVVLIGGIAVVCEKDSIVARFRGAR